MNSDSGEPSVPGADSRPGGDADSRPDLRVATREARRTLDEQLDTLEDIDSKAIRLLQFAVGLSGLVVSVLSLADAGANLDSMPYLGAGLTLLVVGAVVAGVTYAISPRVVGVGPSDLERVANAESGAERQFRRTLVRSYADWIRLNAVANARAAFLITVAILFVVGGAVGLTLGLIRALTGPLSLPVVAVAAFGYLAAAYGTGVHRQFQRLRSLDRPTTALRPSLAASDTERLFEGQRCHTGDAGPDATSGGLDARPEE
ncbi:hypothetical protein [Halogeometricum limi]|uniref:Uncharacterized protein n=1 Tax=Halogeometricum limi TaxID=555875 RepID=A0A1I6I9M5_9EURY|nr:hypothetical protein [Halogeometricum limi]SFR63452.1 hypothetical protein SAMN04488124_2901 [Halogeometricum limi]